MKKVRRMVTLADRLSKLRFGKEHLQADAHLVKHQFSDLIDLSNKQLEELTRSLDVSAMLRLIGSIAAELRRLNQLAADAPGPAAPEASAYPLGKGQPGTRVRKVVKTLTAGGAEAVTNVLADQREIERVLGVLVDANEARQKQDPHRDGEISDPPRGADSMPLARGDFPKDMAQFERYAKAQAGLADQLAHMPDEDGGLIALGVSPTNQQLSATLQKSSKTSLAGDSWSGSQPLGEKLAKQQQPPAKKEEPKPEVHWSQRGRR